MYLRYLHCIIWKIFTNSGSLWVAWVKEYLLKQGSFWDARKTKIGSWIRRKLLKLRPLAAQFLRMEIKNGKLVLFWSDYWHPLGRLIEVVGDIGTQKLGIGRFYRIADVAVNSQWKIRRCRDPHLQPLIFHIHRMSFPSPESGDDVVQWLHVPNDFRTWFSS